MLNAADSHLKRKRIEKLIDEKDATTTYMKPKETTKTSKCWSQFSRIYVSNVKKDFIICDICKKLWYMCSLSAPPLFVCIKTEQEKNLLVKKHTPIEWKFPFNWSVSSPINFFSCSVFIYTNNGGVLCLNCTPHVPKLFIYRERLGLVACYVRYLRSCPSKNNLDLSYQQTNIKQYYNSTTNEITVVPKSIKDAVIAAYTEFVAQDGRAFQMVKGTGFINLAEQLFNSGKLTIIT